LFAKVTLVPVPVTNILPSLAPDPSISPETAWAAAPSNVKSAIPPVPAAMSSKTIASMPRPAAPLAV
jgi:hypothetical protein